MDNLGDFYDLNTEPESSFDSLFKPFNKVKYLERKFDFEIDPDHFVKWVKEEHENDPHSCYDYIEGNYAHNIGNECEFSCLYVAMMLSKKKLKSEPVIYCGTFGFWEHYWIGYFWKGQEYFIDLTLQQFLPEAPKIAISKATNEKQGYNWYEDIERETITEYIERQEAFQFYIDPTKKVDSNKKQKQNLISDKLKIDNYV